MANFVALSAQLAAVSQERAYSTPKPLEIAILHNKLNKVLAVDSQEGRAACVWEQPSDPEFRAFKGGLSMFGVITWLLVQLTPPTNAELTTVVQSDKDMMHDLTRLLKISPHLLVRWRPDAGNFKAFLSGLCRV
ncbi:hypothetical protein COO60DRAFT_1640864 [Scenedesmus sp. NREL 46B-D3]|nr:hypothetical protein COO60DRAFT_1640864 [Scenedesmus sp. NREL 46B-D3]